MGQSYLTRDDHDVGAGSFDSVNWALTEHVKIADTGEYRAALLTGNEDAPERIDFFTDAAPRFDASPAYVWIAAYDREELRQIGPNARRMIARVWLEGAGSVIYGATPEEPAIRKVDYHASDRTCVIRFARAGTVEYTGVSHVELSMPDA